MQIERCCYQHGNVTTFEHSVRVACSSTGCVDGRPRTPVVPRRPQILIRAALLHDYFLYDWHDWDNGEHQWHGYLGHAARQCLKDFKLNDIERNSIENHMFPMTPVPPRYIEGYLVTLADKCSRHRRDLLVRPVQQARVARREALRRDEARR